ncbi:related to Serine/threonine-protein kinase SSN3 [Saccharomycodes ludwigii]|uniref:Cyclin-dependent kinase 8 n=1 Tax=Saccharomycodes ludwigii TaxID=36035 RepID=A0A376B1N5_9ASCO|nr:hypothetical protein SCDLUD_001955 [Saccharomycodes ludwigii]KAH3902142.1 hypothetical protein SCDLUD_001955 [Saccharomycodes ludwigii]SSD58598.1 related to Serine/threonine-protein kinase SSN3 [Saccharomycodes ludwigii]
MNLNNNNSNNSQQPNNTRNTKPNLNSLSHSSNNILDTNIIYYNNNKNTTTNTNNANNNNNNSTMNTDIMSSNDGYNNLQQKRQIQTNGTSSNLATKATIRTDSKQQQQLFLMAGNNVFSIGPYKKRKDASRISVLDKYEIIGYIAAGTYGKVYKAKMKNINNTKDTTVLSNHITSSDTADALQSNNENNKVSHITRANNSLVEKNTISKSDELINTSNTINKQNRIDNLKLDNNSITNTDIVDLTVSEDQESISIAKKSGGCTPNEKDIITIDANIGNTSLTPNKNLMNISAKTSVDDNIRNTNYRRNLNFKTNNKTNSTLTTITDVITKQAHTKKNSGSGPHVNTETLINSTNLQPQMQTVQQAKPQPQYYAIKKFKTDREGVEQLHYTGISQSACREMALCRELDNKHLTKLVEIFLENKSIYMVSEFAEHDLLQIIHSHSHPDKRLIPPRMLKSIMWQIIDGVSYLHQNWILHRDLKPANIMVSVDGCVKIGDLGLARKFNNMVQTLYTGDKVVVTIWYRAPELLLGARHYTPAIDMWAVGCIFAELIGLRPIFKGEEAKMDSKKTVPFQSNQFKKIIELLGTPTISTWPDIRKYPEFGQVNNRFPHYENNLLTWYQSCGGKDRWAFDLLVQLLRYDPITRIDAINALNHVYFTNNDPLVSENIFEGLSYKYPPRRIHTSDNDILGIGKIAQQQQQQQLQTQQQRMQQQSVQQQQNIQQKHQSQQMPQFQMQPKFASQLPMKQQLKQSQQNPQLVQQQQQQQQQQQLQEQQLQKQLYEQQVLQIQQQQQLQLQLQRQQKLADQTKGQKKVVQQQQQQVLDQNTQMQHPILQQTQRLNTHQIRQARQMQHLQRQQTQQGNINGLGVNKRILAAAAAAAAAVSGSVGPPRKKKK